MGIRGLLRRKRGQEPPGPGDAADAPGAADAADAPEAPEEEAPQDPAEEGELGEGEEEGESGSEEDSDDDAQAAPAGRGKFLARLRRSKARNAEKESAEDPGGPGGPGGEEAAGKKKGKGKKKKKKGKKGKKKKGAKKGKKGSTKDKGSGGVVGRLAALRRSGRGDNALARLLFGGVRVGSDDVLPLEFKIYFAPRVPDPVLRDIWWAARKGQIDDVRFFLESGKYSATSKKDPSGAGQTPLHWAASGNQVAVCELLKEHGADVAKADKSGDLPLHVACWWGKTAAASWLIMNGEVAHTEKPNKDAGLTPLHLARMRGHEDLLVKLVPVIDRRWMRDLVNETIDRIVEKKYQYEKKRFELMVAKDMAAEEREAKLKEWEEEMKKAEEAADRERRHERGEFSEEEKEEEEEEEEEPVAEDDDGAGLFDEEAYVEGFGGEEDNYMEYAGAEEMGGYA